MASAGIEQETIVYSLRGFIRRWLGASFLLAEISGIDLAGESNLTDAGTVPYYYLVVTAGRCINFSLWKT